MKFRASPVTIHVEYTDGRPPVTVLGHSVTLETTGGTPPHNLLLESGGDIKLVGLETIDTSQPMQWTGVGGPQQVTVRPTVEEDAVASPPIIGAPAIPMPLPVLEQILYASEGVMVPVLYAMSEDDGFVVTLMLSTDQGLYVRFSGAWHLITNDDVVDGLNVTEIEGSGLDMFDQFDRAGQLVHVSAMPLANEPVIAPAQTTTAPATATVASGVAVKETPRLDTADDLPTAISAAVGSEELQWWVERRAKALGLSAEFPWAE